MDKRVNKLSVFLTADELEMLDSARGGMSRARAIRLLLSGDLPAPIPQLNLKLHADLGRALGNISALAAASRRGGFIPESQLLPALHELRLLLISGKAQLSGEAEE